MPHKDFTHRQKAYGYLILIITCAGLFTWLFLSNIQTKKHSRMLGSQTDVTPSQVISITNLYRLQHNLQPLTPNPLLQEAATLKAQDMLNNDYWDHISKTNRTPWYFLDQVRYSYLYAGENLAKDFTTTEILINAWLGSAKHRTNLLSPNYSDIGVAVVSGQWSDGTPTVIVVQLMASPLSDSAALASSKYNHTPLIVPPATSITNTNQTVIVIGILTSVTLGIFLLLEYRHRLRNSRKLSSTLWHH